MDQPDATHPPSPTDSLISEVYISGEEWLVEDILAERVMKGDMLGRPANERCWLVKWEGFPLAEATWEPRKHLEAELLKKWEEEKAQHLAGTKKPFKVREWKRAYEQHWKKKIQKQEANNRRRVAAGKKPQPVDDFEHARESLKSVDSEDDSDEDVDWETLDQDGRDREDRRGSSSSEVMEQNITMLNDSDADTDTDVEEQERSTRQDRQEPASQIQTETQSFPSGSLQPAATERETKKATREAEQRSPSKKKRDSAPSPRKAAQPEKGELPQAQHLAREAQLSQVVPSGQHPPTVGAHVGQNLSQGSMNLSRKMTLAPDPLRAIRTQSGDPTVTGNVFTGGNKAKKRKTLDQVAENSNIDPKLLNRRHQRIIEKRLRDNEGTRDPRLALRRKPTSSIATGTSSSNDDRGESSLFVSPSPNLLDATTLSNHLADATSPSVLGSGESILQAGQGDSLEPPRPRDKEATEPTEPSVLITHSEVAVDLSGGEKRKTVRFGDDENVHMDLDDDEDMVDAAEDEPSHANVPYAGACKDVTKVCQLGGSEVHTLQLVFTGLSCEALSSQLAPFEEAELLCFTHYCSEYDFSFANTHIRASTIAEGQVIAPNSNSSVSTIHARLAATGGATLCCLAGLCVIIKPRSSPGSWPVRASPNKRGVENLSFAIFLPTPTFEPQILQHFDYDIVASSRHTVLSNILTMNSLLSFQSQRLLPSQMSPAASTAFFLLFPGSREAECLLVAQWLRQCNPSSGILSSVVPGHWSLFRSFPSGVVIIHCDAVDTIRLLPNLGELLWSPHDVSTSRFWVFGRTLRQEQIEFEGEKQGSPEGLEAPVLRPILVSGTVFLITPSFMFAQPEGAYNFLKWFSKKFLEVNKPTETVCKLAVFGDFDHWLSQLLDNTISTTRDDEQLQAENVLRLKTRRLLAKMLSANDPDDDDLLTNPLVVAPINIDANDEQSLVNWFSWWATRRFDSFRRFEVIGTGQSDSSRLSRRVIAPRYWRSSVQDPGVSMDNTEVQDLDQSTADAPMPTVAPREAVILIQQGLKNIEMNELSQIPLAILFRRPVSYFAPGMAVNLGVSGPQCSTYDEWFSFFFPLDHIRRPTKNTYIGFFYTIEDEWDPNMHPDEMPLLSRPWFAVFRPQNPHQKPWTSAELFIWDAFLSKKLSAQDQIFEGDLIPAQRSLISIVTARNKERNPRIPLKQVWAAGFESSDPSANPIGHTLNRLVHLFNNFRSDLHARSDLLPKCGWTAVQRGLRPTEKPLRSTLTTSNKALNYTLGESDEEEEEGVNRKVVFHPPKGTQSSFSIQVENRLLREAQRAKDAGQEAFDFAFTPTTQWYKALKAAKRHSEHIRVAPWDTIFRELGLPIRPHIDG